MSKVSYRAKVQGAKHWIYRQPFHIRGTWYMYSSLWDKVPIEHRTISQKTGKGDINNNDIYENDIVKHEHTRGNTRIDVIKFSSGSFGTDQWHLDDMNKVEVIGNVFDNPELLEDDSNG